MTRATILEGISLFGFSDRAKLAVEAALAARSRLPEMGSDRIAGEFADQLTRWLVEQGLIPVHVAPDDFRRFVSHRLREIESSFVGSN